MQQCAPLVSNGGKHAVQCPRQHRDRHSEHVPVDVCCALQLIAVLDVPQTEAASHRAACITSVIEIDTTPAKRETSKRSLCHLSIKKVRNASLCQRHNACSRSRLNDLVQASPHGGFCSTPPFFSLVVAWKHVEINPFLVLPLISARSCAQCDVTRTKLPACDCEKHLSNCPM